MTLSCGKKTKMNTYGERLHLHVQHITCALRGFAHALSFCLGATLTLKSWSLSLPLMFKMGSAAKMRLSHWVHTHSRHPARQRSHCLPSWSSLHWYPTQPLARRRRRRRADLARLTRYHPFHARARAQNISRRQGSTRTAPSPLACGSYII